MKNKIINWLLPDAIDIVVALFLVLGINFWFSACSGTKDDGTYMNCHYAENVIKAITYILLGLSVIKTAIPNKHVKAGISIGVIALSLLMMLVPLGLIKLCGMETMACNANMKPYTIMYAVIFMAIEACEVLYDFFILKKKNK